MTYQRNETPEPLAQEQAGEMAIRKALEEFPKGWQTVFQEVREREPGVVEIGALWEDSEDLAEVITIDTGNYYDNASAMPMARFIAACNPIAVAAILATLQAKDAEIARLKANLRDREAHLFEARKLLDERPAINAGLFEAYSKWTGKVYSLDWLNAIDAMKGEAP